MQEASDPNGEKDLIIVAEQIGGAARAYSSWWQKVEDAVTTLSCA